MSIILFFQNDMQVMVSLMSMQLASGIGSSVAIVSAVFVMFYIKVSICRIQSRTKWFVVRGFFFLPPSQNGTMQRLPIPVTMIMQQHLIPCPPHLYYEPPFILVRCGWCRPRAERRSLGRRPIPWTEDIVTAGKIGRWSLRGIL